jgi:hypothetical protein
MMFKKQMQRQLLMLESDYSFDEDDDYSPENIAVQ